jgi:hypothetical protein
MTQEIVTGHMAHILAGRLTAQGYQVNFPPGRDPAAFVVVSLPGGPDVEVRPRTAVRPRATTQAAALSRRPA